MENKKLENQVSGLDFINLTDIPRDNSLKQVYNYAYLDLPSLWKKPIVVLGNLIQSVKHKYFELTNVKHTHYKFRLI